MKTWKQDGNNIIIEHDNWDIYFTMPEWFKLSHVDDSAKSLVEYLLFYPFEKVDLIPWNTRWDYIWLAYSWGSDSTAAYTILKNTNKLKCFYHKRVWCKEWLMKQDNPLHTIGKNNIQCEIIESNHESIRTHYWYMAWFSCDWSPLCATILMASFYSIWYLSTWTMLESTFLQKWQVYRDFGETKYRKGRKEIFEKCWFKLFIPTIWCSEYITSMICKKEWLHSSPCIRWKGKPCMNCYKCYRKEALKGNLIDMPKEAKMFLSKRPVKQAASLIHAMNKYNLDIPELSEYRDLDTWRIEYYYLPALDLVPNEWKLYSLKEIIKYCDWTETDDIKSFDIFTSIS